MCSQLDDTSQLMIGEDRISREIARARDCLKRRVRMDTGAPLPVDFDLEAFEKTLDNTIADHFAYQTLQARSHALGRLKTAEAQVIYVALGEVPEADGWAAGTDLATKLVVTSVLGSLLGRS